MLRAGPTAGPRRRWVREAWPFVDTWTQFGYNGDTVRSIGMGSAVGCDLWPVWQSQAIGRWNGTSVSSHLWCKGGQSARRLTTRSLPRDLRSGKGNLLRNLEPHWRWKMEGGDGALPKESSFGRPVTGYGKESPAPGDSDVQDGAKRSASGSDLTLRPDAVFASSLHPVPTVSNLCVRFVD
jgi:hypothetical protein